MRLSYSRSLPHATPARRADLAPNLAAIGQWPVIVNGDVREADALRNERMLALPGQREHKGLAGGSLRLTKICYQQNTGKQCK